MTALAHNLTNDTRLADAMAVVRELGRDEASGDDALANLAVHFVRQVYDGVFDPAKDVNGEDAATRIFKEYAKAKGKKAFHERSETSQKVQISKLKQLEKAACNPKFDFVDVLNRAITIRQDAIDAKVEVKSPYPAYVQVARDQLKQDDELTDEQLYAIVTKNEVTREVTVEGQLKKAQKILEDLIAGEKNPGVMDNSPEVMMAAEQLHTRLTQLVTEREAREKLEKLIELGMVQQADGSWSLPV